MDILNCEYKFDTKKFKRGYPLIACRLFPNDRCDDIPNSSCPCKQYFDGIITKREYERKVHTWTKAIIDFENKKQSGEE